MTDVQQVRISDLTQDKTIQVRSSLEEDAIDRYKACFDALPPVEVVRTADGNLLADGFHRVTAAKQLGHTHIAANVREGTREDAEEIALLSNNTHGVPLRPWERDRAILRLHKLHPEWSNREMARRMAVSEGTVRNLRKNQRILDELKDAGVPHVEDLNDTVRAQIYAAPPDLRPELATGAARKRWTAEKVREVKQIMADPTLPEADKRFALAGVLPSPKTREEEEQEEQRRLDVISNPPDPWSIHGSTPRAAAGVRRHGSHALANVLDALLTQDPRKLAATLEPQEHTLWAEYLRRMRRWMEDFEDAASEGDKWVLDDLP